MSGAQILAAMRRLAVHRLSLQGVADLGDLGDSGVTLPVRQAGRKADSLAGICSPVATRVSYGLAARREEASRPGRLRFRIRPARLLAVTCTAAIIRTHPRSLTAEESPAFCQWHTFGASSAPVANCK